jgi:orotidine-5'-phosphate decarboxylase
LAVSYKPNIAFYEAYGIKGWMFHKTIDYINETYPAIFTIADAKRGDMEHLNVCQSFLKI